LDASDERDDPKEKRSGDEGPRHKDLQGCSQKDAKFISEAGPEYANLGTIVLASFPRSGNSISRLLLEKITGLSTGSIYLDTKLLSKGWRGEGYTKDVVYVKSHYPIYLKPNNSFPFEKSVVLVRNPYDSVISLFNYMVTKTHDETVSSELFKTKMEYWQKIVPRGAKQWKYLLDYYIDLQKNFSIPLLIVRYEDLMAQPKKELQKILDFSFSKRLDLVAKFKAKIDCACESTFGAVNSAEGYKPRPKPSQKKFV